MCFVVLFTGVLGPRVGLILTWLLSDRVQIAFSGGWVLPLLGVVFLPWTALFYVLVYAPGAGVSLLGWWIVIGGFVLDVLTYSSRMISNRYDSSRARA